MTAAAACLARLQTTRPPMHLHHPSRRLLLPSLLLLINLISFCHAANPSITDISPVTGRPGEVVTLTGTLLNSLSGFYFNGKPADFITPSPTTLLVTIPPRATSGPLSVKLGSSEVSLSFDFIVAPRLDAFAPLRSAPGSVVNLIGANFDNATAVWFGTAPAEFTITAPTQIQTIVPPGITPGQNLRVTVQSDAGFDTAPNTFLVTGSAPLLDSFTPPAGAPGSTLTLIGENFRGVTQVRIGALPADFHVTAETQIQITIPPTSLEMSTYITVVTTGGSTTSTAPLRITRSPIILSVDPLRGSPGGTMVIRGINLNNIVGIGFNGIPSLSWATPAQDQITVTIPANASSGQLSLTNTFGSGVAPSPLTITQAPVLTGFNPASGSAGTDVVITGANFNLLSSPAAVRFGTNAATSISITADTQLHAIVPPNASSDFIILSNAFGTTTSTLPFIVTSSNPILSSIDPPGGPRGTKVRIEGLNLDDVIQVWFDTQPAAGFSSTAPTVLEAIAPAGVTSGFITVSNRHGASPSSTNAFFTAPPRVTRMTPPTLSATQTLTLEGTNLAQVTSVSWGLLNASFNVVSNHLIVTAPTNAYSTSLTVSSPGGLFITTNTAGVQPYISSFSPPYGPPGSVITVTGSGFLSATNAAAIGNTPAITQVQSPNQLQLLVPANASQGPIQFLTETGLATSTNSFYVTGKSDLQAIVRISPTIVQTGDSFTAFFTLTNLGPLSATNVEFVVPALPDSISKPSFDLTLSTIPATPFPPAAGGTGLKTDLLPPGKSLILKLTGTALRDATLRLTASATQETPDPNLLNNQTGTNALFLSVASRTLSIQTASNRAVILSWPDSPAAFQLQFTDDLVPPLLWLPAPGTPTLSASRLHFTNTANALFRSYRLFRAQ